MKMNFHDLLSRFVVSVVGLYTGKYANKFLWSGDGAYSSLPNQSIQRVKEFYARLVDSEVKSPTKSLCAQIECEVIKRLLNKRLPFSGHILEQSLRILGISMPRCEATISSEALQKVIVLAPVPNEKRVR